MRRILLAAGLALSVAGCKPLDIPVAPPQVAATQGWTAQQRAQFYSVDQGSQIMPAAWMANLRAKDGSPFLGDRLARYGYLSNPEAPMSMLPIGFTEAVSTSGVPMVGMTCAACHTREITVGPAAYRIDGGPAFADFQSFVADIDDAVGLLLSDQARFAAFAMAVLGQPASSPQGKALKREVKDWHTRYHMLMKRSLPKNRPWGPARLDAVAMIFNRLTGLDIGPTPQAMIPDNIRRADAPARYPFLWNASIQNRTQWPGFAPNGDDLTGLVRNLGEVFGVFGEFHASVDPKLPGGINYLTTNSANFTGLLAAETLIKTLQPPANPWVADTDPKTMALVARGEAVFNSTDPQVNCASCHGIVQVPNALNASITNWATPIVDVGTDTREVQLMDRCALAGTLAQATLAISKPNAYDKASTILAAAVINTIVQKAEQYPEAALTFVLEQLGAQPAGPGQGVSNPAMQAAAQVKPTNSNPVPCAFGPDAQPALPTSAAYESRVLQGIWAAAPYLHNGSVPTLDDLLKPAAERPAEFVVGPEYDPALVGLARVQPRSTFVLRTTDCSANNSGNSRCGHEFGTQLSPTDKRALLEYLKRL